jgi:hypothetical protein
VRSDEETGPQKLDSLSGTSITSKLQCIEKGCISRISVFHGKKFIFI